MEEVRAHIYVSGEVQGVFYRASTREQASSAGLTGWVRNLADGRVEIVAEGPREDVQSLIDWCHEGPPRARVTDVSTRWLDATGEFSSFTVQR